MDEGRFKTEHVSYFQCLYDYIFLNLRYRIIVEIILSIEGNW